MNLLKQSPLVLWIFVSTNQLAPALWFWDLLLWHKNPQKASCPLFIPGCLSYAVTTVWAGLRAPSVSPVCGGIPQPQPQGYQAPCRNAQALVSTQRHAVPVRLLSMTFHSGKRERENTGHLGSLSLQIAGASRSTTPSQRPPNLAGLQSHPCRLPRTATPMPIREDSRRQPSSWRLWESPQAIPGHQ